jgi:hypothetical protein
MMPGMSRDNITKKLLKIMESLAAVEHERWSHWQRYMHYKGIRQPDGSLLIPCDLVARWEKQIDTPYTDLTEAEKESDREQVKKYFLLIVNALSK